MFEKKYKFNPKVWLNGVKIFVTEKIYYKIKISIFLKTYKTNTQKIL